MSGSPGRSPRPDPIPDAEAVPGVAGLVGRPLVRASLGMRLRTADRLARRLTELDGGDADDTAGA